MRADRVILDTKIWELMGNTFYSVFFGLLVGAVLIWDKGIFSWAGLERSLCTSIAIVLIIWYFLIDWLDANLAPTIRGVIAKKQILYWLVPGMWICAVGVLLIRRDNANVLYCALFAGILYSLVTTACRDKAMDLRRRRLAWAAAKSREYDETMKVDRLCTIVIILDIVLLVLASLMLAVHYKGITGAQLSTFLNYLFRWEMRILSILVLVLLVPMWHLKLQRNEIILMPLYNRIRRRKRVQATEPKPPETGKVEC